MIGRLIWLAVYGLTVWYGATHIFDEEDGPLWLRYGFCGLSALGCRYGGWTFASGCALGFTFGYLSRDYRKVRR